MENVPAELAQAMVSVCVPVASIKLAVRAAVNLNRQP